MGYVMKLVEYVGVAWPGGHPDVPAGAFLLHYDPDGNNGLGEVEWTLDPAAAMVFDSPEAAFQTYMLVSKVRPKDYRGAPNRPLTAATVEVEEWPAA